MKQLVALVMIAFLVPATASVAFAKNACKDEKAKFCKDAKTAGKKVNDCLKEHIAECYRRAEEFGRLHNRASNSEERETLRTTKQHFFLLAKVLERKLSKLQAASGRSVRKLRSG